MRKTFIRQFLITMIVIFVLQALMLTYLFTSFYRSAAQDVKALGENNLKSQAAMIETYLNKGSDVLYIVADTAEHMIRSGASRQEILNYLVMETAKTRDRVDENFTGIYGYLNGSYLDGSGWEPPEDYDPKTRDWYREAIDAEGKMVLSAPYVDAQTGGIIVSFTKRLADYKSVLALDVTLNEVQRITQEMTTGDISYCFIVDPDGLVIAHSDPGEIGKNYVKEKEKIRFISGLRIIKSGSFEMELDGEKCTVFTEEVANHWNVAVVVENATLFRRIRLQLLIGILLSVLIYALIVILCLISVRRITSAEQSEQESAERLKQMNMNIIRSLAFAIDAKDRYTSGHSQRVADYSVRVAKKLGLSEDAQRIVFYAGLLHDVGKISVPIEVINKPGRLTEEEFDQIRTHTSSGYHILRDIHDDSRIGHAAKYHHERYDGKGYPNGLAGKDIPEIARIIAVADAYDAMASNRSYRKLLPQEVIRSEIEKGRGTQFDPKMADAMLEIITEDTEYALHQRSEQLQNVLVIDRDQNTFDEMGGILHDMENIHLFYAKDEDEAMAALSEQQIALIVLDTEMPGEGSEELYRRIKNAADVPVIFLVRDVNRTIVTEVDTLKIDDFLTKPFNAAIVRETVHGILQRDAASFATQDEH